MQFTNEVHWGLGDFIVAGVILFVFAVMGNWAIHTIGREHKVIIWLVLIILFFLVWAELAVGIFGSPFAGS